MTEMEPCPRCGALPCDWVNGPHAALPTAQGVVEALRRIAEGNLGDLPWQANYAKIKEVAAEALASIGEEVA